MAGATAPAILLKRGLGPFTDSAVAWAAWLTLMGFVGISALIVFVAGPAARRVGEDAHAAITARLARAAVVLGVLGVLGVLAVPAVLTDLAHGASETGGYDYGAAWNSLYGGGADGVLSGLEVTLVLLGAVLLAPLAVGRGAAGRPGGGPARARRAPARAGLAAGAIALCTTKFPDKAPDDWGGTVFQRAEREDLPLPARRPGRAAPRYQRGRAKRFRSKPGKPDGRPHTGRLWLFVRRRQAPLINRFAR